MNDLSTEIFRDKNVIQIGDNFLYHSDHTSTVEITFDLVDDVSNLLVPDSPEFLAFEESFCSNVSQDYPLFVGFCVWSFFCYTLLSVLFSFTIVFDEEERAGCFALIVFLVSCDC